MKPIVQYSHIYGPPRVGQPMMLWPVNHPDKENVSNTTWVRTTPVVAVHAAGRFETENTEYVPAPGAISKQMA